jgi:hypothetical protein
VASWRGQWLQFESKPNPICLCQLQTHSKDSHGLGSLVSIPYPMPSCTCPNNYGSITSFNVVVSVFSMFMLLVKLVMFVMHIWIPLLSCIVNVVLIALWTVSIYGQAGPDYSDPQHPSPSAWYVTKSCSYASASGYYGYCMQAKGAFAATCLML